MSTEKERKLPGISRQSEEKHLQNTLAVIEQNIEKYGQQVTQMRSEIDSMLDHFHDDNPELINQLENTITLHEHMSRALDRNIRARKKPYFGRIIFHDEKLDKEESLYIGKGGISKDATHWEVVDWRAPVANAYYENGLGKCSYPSPEGTPIPIELLLKRTYEIEDATLLNYFDSEVIANDELLTKYLARNKQAVLGEIVATIQKEQNEIIRKSPYHNCLVQGVAGSGKTTVAMHRISYILYNYADRFKPDDFYIVGSNRILLNYITSVLPGLDVYGVRQMTMEQLFVRLLYEDWDDKKYRIKDPGPSGQNNAIKGSLTWFHDLKDFCDQLEWNTIPHESILLNPAQFVEGIRDGKTGVFDETDRKAKIPRILLVDGAAVKRYIRQNPTISVQSKINMLNSRLYNKIKEEFLLKGIRYTAAEQKAIVKAYRGYYGSRTWKTSVYTLYADFLRKQRAKGYQIDIPSCEFDVYDLAALAYLYKRIKETEVISEAHHIVIDEAQDFGMMAYSVLKFCVKDCTYTIMGDVSQNIHFGCGLNDWEELIRLYLTDSQSSFEALRKSYRNTIEISEFATNILCHGSFSIYPAQPIIRHGNPVQIRQLPDREHMLQKVIETCRNWQSQNLDTIAIICRDQVSAAAVSEELKTFLPIMENDPEKAEFGKGIMVLPVEYTKGLEFDAVLILDPTRTEYPAEDGHAKLLYVAATRALHELCILHTGNLTGLIADPIPENKKPHKVLPPKAVSKPVPVTQATPQKPATPKPSAATTVVSKKPLDRKPPAGTTSPQTTGQKATPAISVATQTGFSFGDMPPTEKLRPPGHSRIDLAVRWATQQTDGLYLQSRYGMIRLSPITSSIIRVTFAKGNQITQDVHPAIAITKTERNWKYKDSTKSIELLTEEICLQIDKSTGAIRYLTNNRQLLLSEHTREPRLTEIKKSATTAHWFFIDLQKEEKLYALGPEDSPGLSLRNKAFYISHSSNGCNGLPFILSDKGYGILVASDGPTFCCDIPAHGSYLYTETNGQMDFYFIAGKNVKTLVSAYDYLCKAFPSADP